ncbi:MAG: hypothetical protein JSU58_05280 [Dehalococcoidales bacterium]|nr:MAG: hypothetical protein JSU58_05280 [Dehalococcoidales bacterium]
MVPPSCYRKGYESGPWYEIKAVADVIRMKEARGADTGFERGLLKAWSEFPGYESAKDVLEFLTARSMTPETSKSRVVKRQSNKKPQVAQREGSKQPDLFSFSIVE